MAAPRRAHIFLGVLVLLAALPFTGRTQNNPPATRAPVRSVEWRAFGGDDRTDRYSPLDQINRDNVKNLQVAWTWRFDNYGTSTETLTTETTPLMVNGVLYFTAGPRRNVIAANAATGETLWTYRPDEGARFDQAPRKVHRGVAYWTDGRGGGRIFTSTPGFNLVALDAKTGQLVDSFGENGIVDMMRQLDDKTSGSDRQDRQQLAARRDRRCRRHRPGLDPWRPRQQGQHQARRQSPSMSRTGKKVWTFHTIPRKGEFGYETWLNGSGEYTGNAGVWGPLSADPKLGLVYLNIEAATNDTYGGHRPGNNLFSSSIVAVDAKTGKRVWHQQLVHHDIWDYDLPPQPILIDLNVQREGGKVEQIPVDRAAVEAGVRVRVRSPQRQAGVADRRAARASDGRQGRMDGADAAFPDQAAGIRSARHHGQRSDRLHAGAAGRSDQGRGELPPRRDVRPRHAGRRRRPPRHDHRAGSRRRRKLAGRRGRSGNRIRLRRLVHVARCARDGPEQRSRIGRSTPTTRSAAASRTCRGCGC